MPPEDQRHASRPGQDSSADLDTSFFRHPLAHQVDFSSSQARSCFSEDYFRARTKFYMIASDANATQDSIDLSQTGPGGREKKLTINTAYIGDKSAENILIHISGTHGIEGFAGSAIQTALLKSRPVIKDGCAILFLHCLNPYGMAHLRRVAEGNVDPNRNWMQKGWEGAPDGYAELDPLLNPKSVKALEKNLKDLPETLKEKMDQVFRSAVIGQYEYPQGLFFGGKSQIESFQKMEPFLAEKLGEAKRILVLDVHSGLGEHGKYILGPQVWGEASVDDLRSSFGEKISTESMPYFDEVRGAVNAGIASLFPSCKVYGLAQEFGTRPVPRVLSALMSENFAYHHAADKRSQYNNLAEAFNPPEDQWKIDVIRGGTEVVSKCCELLFR